MKTPLVMLVGAVVALVGLCALPWVASDEISITMLQLLRLKAHGFQLAYVMFGALAVGALVGALSLRQSRRWQTAIAAVALLIPAFLSAVVHGGASGAKVALVGAGAAFVSAIVLTIKPVRP